MRAQADRAALAPLPAAPYLVCDRHLRRIGKDCLVSFESSLYSVPAKRVRPGQRVELRVTGDLVAIHALTADTGADNGGGRLLACHPRAARRGAWVVDETLWDGLPDGHTRATCLDSAPDRATASSVGAEQEPNPLAALLADHPGAATAVAGRPLAAYEALAGLEVKRVIW